MSTKGYRLVPFEEAATAEDARRQVVEDSGGALHVGKVEQVVGGWRVTVFSSDGHNELPGLVEVANFADPPIGLKERPQFQSVGQEPCGFWEPRNSPAKPAGQQ